MNNLELTIKNLNALKNGIKAAIKRSKLKLSMGWYRAIQDFDYLDSDGNFCTETISIANLEEVNRPTCGSSCCVLGFSPFIPGLAAIEEDFTSSVMDYVEYSTRIFPYLSRDEWSDLFGDDNTNSVDDFMDRAAVLITDLQKELKNDNFKKQ